MTVVEPYNTVLCTDSLLEHRDVTLVVVSETLYEIRRCNLDVERTASESGWNLACLSLGGEIGQSDLARHRS